MMAAMAEGMAVVRRSVHVLPRPSPLLFYRGEGSGDAPAQPDVASLAIPGRSSGELAGKSPLRLVFLEGNAGVGKSTICKRLDKMGYRVFLENFVGLCAQYPGENPQSASMTLRWASHLLQAIEGFTKTFEQSPSTVKHGLVFFDRSFLSPAVYGQQRLSRNFDVLGEVMLETRAKYNCSVVLCETSVEMILLRLQHRYAIAESSDEKGIRGKLGEVNEGFVRDIHRRYASLFEAGSFDYKLDTTDTRQATASLLRTFEVPFALPTRPDAESVTLDAATAEKICCRAAAESP